MKNHEFAAALVIRRTLLMVCLLWSAAANHFSYINAQHFTLVELNCENLFDCVHDSLKQDYEFLPESGRKWTPQRYWRKLNNIGREILSCTPDTVSYQLPDLVALCEVENDSVVFDLIRRSLLRRAGYEYIVTSSPDERGLDVALLYQPFSFAPVSHHPIRITPLPNMRPTRDILYVSGRIQTGDTLHVFVVHAPSRYGGEQLTRPYRMHVARRLMQSVDSLRAVSPQASVIVAGDFNDYTDDASLAFLEQSGLTEVSRSARGTHGAEGTYCFQGFWGSLDHVFATPSLAASVDTCYVNDAPFLMEEDTKYAARRPRRTYQGYRYQPGYSDHLPLVVRFRLAAEENILNNIDGVTAQECPHVVRSDL